MTTLEPPAKKLTPKQREAAKLKLQKQRERDKAKKQREKIAAAKQRERDRRAAAKAKEEARKAAAKARAARPLRVLETGPRQPQIELPTTIDGSKVSGHPLLWMMKHRMPEGYTKSEIARRLGVKPQSVYKWEASCRANRNFPVPIIRAKQLADVFNVSPAVLRPDAF